MGGKARSQSSVERGPRVDTSPARVAGILRVLKQVWGAATCELDHADAYQLLVATMLSAQTTDRCVNEVTPALFARYPDARALARAGAGELEALIRPTGLYRMKARHLIDVARGLCERHGGEVPRTMSELVKLRGVDRKTASLVLGAAFGLSPVMVVDAHVQRVSRRLGLTAHTGAREVERDLMAIVPRERWIDVANELIWHGRRVCHARSPVCGACALAPLCPSARVAGSAAAEAGPARPGARVRAPRTS